MIQPTRARIGVRFPRRDRLVASTKRTDHIRNVDHRRPARDVATAGRPRKTFWCFAGGNENDEGIPFRLGRFGNIQCVGVPFPESVPQATITARIWFGGVRCWIWIGIPAVGAGLATSELPNNRFICRGACMRVRSSRRVRRRCELPARDGPDVVVRISKHVGRGSGSRSRERSVDSWRIRFHAVRGRTNRPGLGPRGVGKGAFLLYHLSEKTKNDAPEKSHTGTTSR